MEEGRRRLPRVFALAARDGGGAQMDAPDGRPEKRRARAAARLDAAQGQRPVARAAAVRLAERLPGDHRRAPRDAGVAARAGAVGGAVRGAVRRDPCGAARTALAARLPTAQDPQLGVQEQDRVA
eukprot:610948-Prymnesium_polylepis.1